jgi:hypothetical protein
MTSRRRIGSREVSLREPPPHQAHSYQLPGSDRSLLAGWNTQKHHHKQVDALTF